MSDAVIRLDASGNLVATAEAISQALRRAAKDGGQVGPETEKGLKGAIERAREFSKRMNEFMSAGAGLYRITQAGVEAWAAAHEAAAQRINAANAKLYAEQKRSFDGMGKARADAWDQMGTWNQVRMAGVQDNKTGSAIVGQLGVLQGPIGDDIRKHLFPAIAQQIASLRLDSGGTGQALLAAAGSLNKYGHVAGFGDAYADLAGMPGMAGREDLGDRSLALALRRARMTGSERSGLDDAMKSGGIAFGTDGDVRGKPGFEAMAKLLNGMGGLRLDPGNIEWKPIRGHSIGGASSPSRPGDSDAYALPENFRGPQQAPPWAPEAVKSSDISLKDMVWSDVKAGLGTLAQQSLAAAVAISAMAVAARFTAPSAASAAAGPVATAGGAAGGAAAGAGTTAAAARLGVAVRSAGVVGAILSIGGDSAKRESTEDQIAEAARLAKDNPELRRSYMNAELRGDQRASAILEKMHQILMEQLAVMRAGGNVLKPAQVGE